MPMMIGAAVNDTIQVKLLSACDVNAGCQVS